MGSRENGRFDHRVVGARTPFSLAQKRRQTHREARALSTLTQLHQQRMHMVLDIQGS